MIQNSALAFRPRGVLYVSGYSFSHLTGPEILREYSLAKAVGRASDALLLAFLGEIEARNLFLDAGYSSMYAFVASEFDFGDEATKKRIRLARAAHLYPQVLPMLSCGRLSPSSFLLLVPHLNQHNVDDLLSSAADKTRSELDRILSARFPRTELMSWTMGAVVSASSTDREPDCTGLVSPGTPDVPPTASSPTPLATLPVSQPPVYTPQTRVTPIAAKSSGVQFMMEGEAQDDFDYLRSVLGHEAPTPAKLFALALKALRRDVDRRKFSATDRPQRPRETESRDPRHVPAHIRRKVFERDNYRCTFESDTGRRCDARSSLELDHIKPIAQGGESTVENLRVLCDAHNQHAAEQRFGTEFMEAKREEARKARAG